MSKLDFTEYTPDSSEKYIRDRSNRKSVLLDTMSNRVRFDDNTKTLSLLIDERIAYEFESAKAESGVHPEPFEQDYDSDPDGLYTELKQLAKRFDIEFYDTPFHENLREEAFADNSDKNAGKNYPYYANALSGARVTLPLGQGLLDFLYFDTKKNLSALTFISVFHSDDAVKKLGGKVKDSVSVKNRDEYDRLLNVSMERTMDAHAFFYSSLYTAAFPPCFLDFNEKSTAFYLRYLSVLRKELLEKIEFCFDRDYFPEVLGNLSPAQRYSLYCSIRDIPSVFSSTSDYKVVTSGGPKEMLPFFTHGNRVIDGEQMDEFRRKYGLAEDYNIYQPPKRLRVVTQVSSIFEMLNYEFFKMLECDVTVRKCRNCGRYFVVKGNYNTEYCDRPVEGSVRTCQAVGAEKAYKDKISSEDAWRLYKKYYKRYYARIAVGTIKEKDFRRWNAEAAYKRDDCLTGTLSSAEYEEWLEGSFSNRIKKDKK